MLQQGALELSYILYTRLKLGGDEAYDRSSDQTAVVGEATRDRAYSVILRLD
jgi:hypothetical protein